MIWTAEKLLKEILEFISMTPNQEEWNEQVLSYNKPRLIRFKMINSLLKAFELIQIEEKKAKTGFNIFTKKSRMPDPELNQIGLFLRGDFINQRQLSDYKESVVVIDKHSFRKDKDTDLSDISRFFRHLLDYRIEADAALRYNDGVLEASNKGFQAAISLSVDTNKVFKQKITTIDSILIKIIDPDNKEFEQKKLIEKFEFPTENLEQVDFENI